MKFPSIGMTLQGKIALAHLMVVVILYALLNFAPFPIPSADDVFALVVLALLFPVGLVGFGALALCSEYPILATLLASASFPLNSYLWAFVITHLIRWRQKRWKIQTLPMRPNPPTRPSARI
jgi:hypothetical protein